MKIVDSDTTDAWLSGAYIGERKAHVRAVIYKVQVLQVPVNIPTAVTGEASRLADQLYTSVIFGQLFQPVELPNIVQLNWERTVRDQIATATIVLDNNAASFPGEEKVPGTYVEGDFGYPGWYTWNRGVKVNPWGLTPTGWQDLIIPDRVICTYEGYGIDPFKTPEEDEHMYPSGTWLIDSVEYEDTRITIKCRDIGRILLDHLWMPPVVPLKKYPLNFEKYWIERIQNPPLKEVTTGWIRPGYSYDSGVPWFGAGTPVFGHLGAHAFDGDPNSYWVSMGNYSPNAPYSFEYVEGNVNNATVTGVKIRVVGGPYTAFVSIMSNGAWQGANRVPYDPHHWASYPNGSDVPFVTQVSVAAGGLIEVAFPGAGFANVTKVRVCFTNLWNSGLRASTTAGGGKYPYRAAVSDFQVTSAVTTYKPVPDTFINRGNYGDYTDIVKLILAYAGWYWPNSNKAIIMQQDGTIVQILPAANDPMLGVGRVWGDFENTGTTAYGPQGEYRSDEFDKQTLLDCIKKIQEIVGFNFFIDERGAAVFRPMNIWSVGNYVQATDPYTVIGAVYAHTTELVDITEDAVLSSLSVTLSSDNVREKIFVASTDGGGADGQLRGAVVNGWNPAPSGFRRVAGWTDKNFTSGLEAVVMADMIALRQMFRYRTNRVVIPGYPKITVDDQIRLQERISNETYVHYISGIQSEFEAESGRWTYTLDTHWLGDSPLGTDIWAFNLQDMAPETVEFLKSLGVIPDDVVIPPVTSDVPAGGVVPTSPVTLPPNTGELKGRIGGFLGSHDEAEVETLTAYEYDLWWSEIQPDEAGQPIPEDVLLALQTENVRAASLGKDIRIVIHAGYDAPYWAKTLGSSSQIYTGMGYIGRVWTPEYTNAYMNLVYQVAQAVRPLSSIKEITMAGLITDSFFDMGWDNMMPGVLTDFIDAGYTPEKMRTAMQAVVIAHRSACIPNGMASVINFQPYRELQSDESVIDADNQMYIVMNNVASTMGKYAVLEGLGFADNATSSDVLNIRGSAYKNVWQGVSAKRASHGCSVSYQIMSLDDMMFEYEAGAPTPYGSAKTAGTTLLASVVRMPDEHTTVTGSAPTGNKDPAGDYMVTLAEATPLISVLRNNKSLLPK